MFGARKLLCCNLNPRSSANSFDRFRSRTKSFQKAGVINIGDLLSANGLQQSSPKELASDALLTGSSTSSGKEVNKGKEDQLSEI